MNDRTPLSVVVMEERALRNLGRVMLVTRWVLAPMYLGLIGALVLLTIKFVQKLVVFIPQILRLELEDTVLLVLSLVDISLVANLVIIVMFAGWENFVGRFLSDKSLDRPGWLDSLGFGEVKIRLIGSILAIAVIQILETFVHVGDVPKQDVLWQLAILLGIGVVGVMMAAMDRLVESHSGK